MPANRFNGFTNLGIGIGLRVEHYQKLIDETPPLDWLEIISENYMAEGGRALSILEQILEHYTVIQHGVSLYLGSSDPLNKQYLKKLKKLANFTKTPFVSDHLCWGSVDGTYSHDLLPLPYTFEAVLHTASRIRAAQEYLEIPVCIENVSSYAEFSASQMTEWQFLSEVAERADCGILLDVNNIYVSSCNHGFDSYDYLRNIPFDRVAQIHVAGHSELDKYLLDTHEGPVKNEVWSIYKEAIKLIGPTNTLLEWDTNIPSFEAVHAEALKANKIIEELELELSRSA
jgi:uncharacterized protein (UPF0276 family)